MLSGDSNGLEKLFFYGKGQYKRFICLVQFSVLNTTRTTHEGQKAMSGALLYNVRSNSSMLQM